MTPKHPTSPTDFYDQFKSALAALDIEWSDKREMIVTAVHGAVVFSNGVKYVVLNLTDKPLEIRVNIP
jgi:hypothetical protein